MHLTRRLALLWALSLFLIACQPQQSKQAQQELAAARSKGDLEQQISALTTLLKSTTDKQTSADYKRQMARIEQIKALNEQAQAILSDQPFEALKLAVKSDQRLYNQPARKLIISMLTPYRDFLPLHRDLREWSVIPIKLMVAPDSLPESLGLWYAAMEAPNLWPDNNLMELLKKNPARLSKMLYPVVEEREKFAAILRQLKRVSNNAPDDWMLQSVYQQGQQINAMYNTVITDLHWFYLHKGLLATIKANNELIEVAKDAVKDGISTEQWMVDFKLSEGIHQDKISLCCTYYAKKVEEHFPFLEALSPFDTAVKTLHKTFEQQVKDNFVPSKSAKAAIKFGELQNRKFAQIIENIEPLSKALDRKQISADYLRATYNWQQDSFNDLEKLIPFVREYKTSLRGY